MAHGGRASAKLVYECGVGRAFRGEAELDLARLQDAGKEGLTALSAAEKELRAAGCR